MSSLDRGIPLLAIALAFTGCVTLTNRPVRLQASGAPDALIDTVVRTLASNGYAVASTDRATGIVQTEWQDTGFGYGFIKDEGATIHRRFVVVLSPAASGTQVLVRMDTKRCGPAHAQVMSTQTTTQPAGDGVAVQVGALTVSAGAPQTTTTTTTIQSQPAADCEPMDGLVEQHQQELDRLGGELKSALGAAAVQTAR